MSLYQHILVAVDYSESTPLIADRAIVLAAQHQARLSVVHVVDDVAMPDTAYGTSVNLQAHSDDSYLEAEKDKLLKWIDRLAVDVADAWMIWGNPKREIVELADKLGVDLIVTGSHGRHGWERLLGSTANAVLHHARCDVMAVRIFEPEPLLSAS